jgi:glycosyltransferase involved in cell wall biosynthesis
MASLISVKPYNRSSSTLTTKIDGSTDKTLEILDIFKPEIKIVNQPNAGEANAVNTGISLAKGRFVLVVSADDPLISEELFDHARNIMDSDEKIVAVYPDWQMIDLENNIIAVKLCPDYSFEELLGEFHCIPGPGTVFRTKEANQIGGRNGEYRFVSDYDFWLRLASRGKFAHIPQVLAQWRSHNESTSIGKRGHAMALERIDVIRNFLVKYPQTEDLSRQAKACSLYNAAILAFFDSDVPGRKWMVEALLTNRRWVKSSKLHIVAYLLTLPFSRIIFRSLSALGLMKKKRHR